MPALKIPYRFPDIKARNAVDSVNQDMAFLASNPDFLKSGNLKFYSDYFLGLLWIEGYKVVPLTDTDKTQNFR